MRLPSRAQIIVLSCVLWLSYNICSMLLLLFICCLLLSNLYSTNIYSKIVVITTYVVTILTNYA